MTPLQAADHYVRHAECNRELMEKVYDAEALYAGELGYIKECYLSGNVINWARFLYKEKLPNGKMDLVFLEKDQLNLLEILGRPPQLQHWLRLLECIDEIHKDTDILRVVSKGKRIYFSLTTSAPATDEDAKKFLELCGVEIGKE